MGLIASLYSFFMVYDKIKKVVRMKKYFYKKEYKYIYLSKFCYYFAYALIETFGTVMLYRNQIPIWLILMVYGLRFGITGICTPFFMKISCKFGIAKVILISNIFSFLASYMMLITNDLSSKIVIFIIFMGLMGLSNPAGDALSSKYVTTDTRGRFNAFLNVSKISGAALSSVVVAGSILSDNKNILLVLIGIFFFLDFLFTLKIDYKTKSNNNAFKETFNYIIKSKSKYKWIYALKTNHIIERLFLPLYLYILLKDFKMFSQVVIISLFLQIITIMLIGRYTDKNIRKYNNLVSIIRIFITSIFLLIKNKYTVSINKMVSDNFDKVYDTSIQTSIQNIIKKSKEDNALLSSVGQMTLCFMEVIVFAVLVILALFINEKVLLFIFAFSIISTILINVLIYKENKN